MKLRHPKKTKPCACTKSGPRENARLRDEADDICAKRKPETGKGIKPHATKSA